jgi:uncharacterized glyoxalase superfamily protein PhnB
VTRFKKIVPVFKVANMDRAVDFYTSVLGFQLLWRSADDAGGEICMLQLGETELLCSTGSHLGDKPCFTGTLYFHMDGVREYYGQVKDQVEIVWPLEEMEYGLIEFGLRDRDGYVLAFAEEKEA